MAIGTVAPQHGAAGGRDTTLGQPAPLPAKSSFAERFIDIKFLLGKTGAIDADYLPPVAMVKGLRIHAEIEYGGGQAHAKAQLRIFGLRNETMNQLSSLGFYTGYLRNNVVEVYAGDTFTPVSLVFRGTIDHAWQEFGSAPETSLTVDAYAGSLQAVLKNSATSFPGEVDAVTVLGALAVKADLHLANNGVSGIMLHSPNYHGSIDTQIKECLKEADLIDSFSLDMVGGSLVIWPKYGSRSGIVSLVSPETGMIGYPTSGGPGSIRVACLYNPALAFGGNVEVKSVVARANGLWRIYRLVQSLQSQTPGGHWQTLFEANNPGADPQGDTGVHR